LGREGSEVIYFEIFGKTDFDRFFIEYFKHLFRLPNSDEFDVKIKGVSYSTITIRNWWD
jgi:hypothetical protein